MGRIKENKGTHIHKMTHGHLPSWGSLLGLCLICSMHFSCSRLIIQCSDSEATCRKQIKYALAHKKDNIFMQVFILLFCRTADDMTINGRWRCWGGKWHAANSDQGWFQTNSHWKELNLDMQCLRYRVSYRAPLYLPSSMCQGFLRTNQHPSILIYSHFPAAADKTARNHSVASDRYRTGPFHELLVATKTELKEDSPSGWKFNQK